MSTDQTFAVQGMTCTSCATKVTNAVVEVEGVDDVAVDITTGTLTVNGTATPHAVRDAVTAAGYQVS